jgi:hypothetical protein
VTDIERPHPYRPILKAIVPPPEGLTDPICIQIDRKWQPYLLTMLTPLLVNRTWESDAHRATEEASTLITQIMLAECTAPGTPEEGDCVEYTPQNAPVWWGPTNPFINPYDIPAGYILPPWVVVPEAGVFLGITGLQIGDVITTPLSFPIGIPPAHPDITKFRIYCFGSGTVEIHLIQFPLGGVALITNDDDPLTLKTVELNRDLLQIPPETVSVLIHETKLETEGSHHIDVTFERRLGDELIPIGFGGGLRKVVLCGFDIPGESVDVRQNVDAPCTLEKSADGETWVPFADLQLCPPKIRTDRDKIQILVDGIWVDLEQPDERQEGDADPAWPEEDLPEGEDGNCLAAENIVAVFSSSLTIIRQGVDAGLVASVIGATLAGIAGVFITPALFAAAGLAVASAAAALGTAGIDDMLSDDTLEKFKCAIACNINADGSVTASQYNDLYDQIGDDIDGLKGDIIQNWIDGFGPVGLTRQGAAGGITTGDCDGCCDWLYEVNWTIGADGWTVRTGHNTTFGASGFVGGCDDQGLGLDRWHQAVFERTLNATARIKNVKVWFDRTYSGFDDGADGAFAAVNFTEGGGGTAIGSSPDMTTGAAQTEYFDTTAVDVVDGDYLTIAVVDGYLDSRGNCDSFGAGAVTAYRAEIRGSGTNPFL